MSNAQFATVINCMDGRTQLPALEWTKSKFQVDYVDSITEPGPDGILAKNNSPLVESIKNRIVISTQKHGSKNIILVGHFDCAGNPVEKKQHLEELQKSKELLASWNLNAQIYLIWIGENWQVEEIK